MSACPKCGRGVEDSWSVCMACGTPLRAAAVPAVPMGPATTPAAPMGPAAGVPGAPMPAPGMAPGAMPGAPMPAPGMPPGMAPGAPPAGVFAAAPPPPAPGDFEIPRYQGGTAPAGKPGFKPWILIVILLVVVAVAGIIYFVWESGDGDSSTAVDRAKAGAQKMGDDLKDELKQEWRELDREPDAG
ncbi:MAG: zinc ribbon domain-containing protein [Deltaproteobacteria bacterium]|nr:zinc ribbon domain-containing protein [Deltaproteobacteria bacterium]